MIGREKGAPDQVTCFSFRRHSSCSGLLYISSKTAEDMTADSTISSLMILLASSAVGMTLGGPMSGGMF